jgi:mannose-6-phosphate isomerase-like protein (cupin superfamily)
MQAAREVRVTVDEISLGGAIVETLVRGDQVNGLFTLLRYTAPPASVGAPLHRHAVTAEVFHVVDGELTIELDGEVRVLGAGQTATVPVGSVHGFRNASNRAVTFLVVAAPPGLERFLGEPAELIAVSPEWPPVDRTALTELNARYDQLPPSGP